MPYSYALRTHRAHRPQTILPRPDPQTPASARKLPVQGFSHRRFFLRSSFAQASGKASRALLRGAVELLEQAARGEVEEPVVQVLGGRLGDGGAGDRGVLVGAERVLHALDEAGEPEGRLAPEVPRAGAIASATNRARLARLRTS